jgi:hypothetical protein
MVCKWGKTPGTQVQHTLNFGTIDTEFRHFSTIDFVTVQIRTKSARGFCPTYPLPPQTIDKQRFLGEAILAHLSHRASK